MRMWTTAELITFSPDAHEVGTAVTETKRTVKVQEMSLTQAEVYQAGGDGLQPDAKLLIPYDRDWQNERDMIYRGERWKVLRADPYKDWNGVILLIRCVEGNASADWTVPATTSGEVG